MRKDKDSSLFVAIGYIGIIITIIMAQVWPT
jgi:hypothetical protein